MTDEEIFVVDRVTCAILDEGESHWLCEVTDGSLPWARDVIGVGKRFRTSYKYTPSMIRKSAAAWGVRVLGRSE